MLRFQMTNEQKSATDVLFLCSITMGEARVFWKKALHSPIQYNSGGEAHDIVS